MCGRFAVSVIRAYPGWDVCIEKGLVEHNLLKGSWSRGLQKWCQALVGAGRQDASGYHLAAGLWDQETECKRDGMLQQHDQQQQSVAAPQGACVLVQRAASNKFWARGVWVFHMQASPLTCACVCGCVPDFTPCGVCASSGDTRLFSHTINFRLYK